MPELPEVETVCRSLRPHLVGRTIRRVRVLEPRLRLPVDAKGLKALAGKRIDAITRIAKYIVFYLSGDTVWVFHLGMSGKLICVAPSTARKKHDHIIVHLDDGAELRYHDPRRFGLSLVTKRRALHELPQLHRIGLDPFDPALSERLSVSLHARIRAPHSRLAPRSTDYRRAGQYLRERDSRLGRHQAHHARASFNAQAGSGARATHSQACSATRFAGAARRFPTIAMATINPASFRIIYGSTTATASDAGFVRA